MDCKCPDFRRRILAKWIYKVIFLTQLRFIRLSFLEFNRDKCFIKKLIDSLKVGTLVIIFNVSISPVVLANQALVNAARDGDTFQVLCLVVNRP